MTRVGLATAASLLMTTLASAADVQVTYVVNDRPLKQAISGTPLTFDLYSDPTCSTPVGSVVAPIDDVFIERLKRFKPPGGAALPKTARLTHVVSAAPPSGALYLAVSGAGIAPIGGGCQVQYSPTIGTALPCASQVGNEVIFEGCNVNVRDGSGSTAGPTNGRGNLVIGYNERGTCTAVFAPDACNTDADCPTVCFEVVPGISLCNTNLASCTTDADCPASSCASPVAQTGSHNLLVGRRHAHGGYGNVIGGEANTVGSGHGNAILAGDHNSITGSLSVVLAGTDNSVTTGYGAVAAGSGNLVSDAYGAVVGGSDNVAAGAYSAVLGGTSNTARADAGVVAGGQCNLAGIGARPTGCTASGFGDAAMVAGGFQNQASGDVAAVGGGTNNLASGQFAWISGGTLNEARAQVSSVLGGQCNVAGTGPKLTGCVGLGGSNASTVGGGFQNLASGNHSSVTGGNDNTASGGSSVVSSGNGTTQATGFGWSAGAFGALINGRITSP